MDQNSDLPLRKRKRRWFQFTLRTFLAAVTLFCIAGGLFAMWLGEGRRERDAVQQLRDLGATVSPADAPELIAGHPGSFPERRGGWDVVIGDRWRGKLSDLVLIKRLNKVYTLRFYGLKELGDDVDFLNSPTVLEELTLDDVPISEKLVGAVARLSTLKKLCINRLKITDDEMARFSQLDQLEEIELGGINVGDKGLMGLLALPKMAVVNVAGTKVTDKSVAKLNGAVVSMNLCWTAVTDASADQLAKSQQLEDLDLGHTRLTGSGLQKLVVLEHLRDLNVAGTRLSDADVNQFMRATHSKQVKLLR